MQPAFCFVVCVSDEEFWARCLTHLEALEVPDGHSVDIRKITGAKGLPSAYDAAMKSSDAHYKVYLHQDTFILDRYFLHHLRRLFRHPQVGMVGAVGGTRLPKSGVWFHDGLHSFGKIMRYGRRTGILNAWLPHSLNPGRIRLFRYLPVWGEYLPVACVDGLMMATQYDVPWRTDFFDGFIYYEGPQCLEFIKRGLEVVVPRQRTPWCLHWGADRSPEEDRSYHASFRKVMDIFRREYSEFLGKDIATIRRMVTGKDRV